MNVDYGQAIAKGNGQNIRKYDDVAVKLVLARQLVFCDLPVTFFTSSVDFNVG